jgi:hypothetical protein
MPYEDAFTPDDMLDGYPSATAVMPASEPPPVADFDPRRDIDPMAKKLFTDIGAERHLRPEDKIALQSKLLAGINDVSAQRSKLEAERRQSMMNNLRIEQAQGSLAAMRQRQQTAVEQTAARATFTDAVKGVMSRTDLDPLAKSAEIDRLTTENLGFVAADPDAARAVSTAKSMIPLPKVSTLTEAQIMEAAESGVPAELVATGDPYVIGATKALLDANRKAMSEKVEDRKAAQKEKATLLKDLAKDDFRFIPNMERSQYGIDPNDKTPYLLQGDHTRGRQLASLLLTPEEYKAFDALPDAEKRDEMRKLQIRALTMAVETATSEVKSDDDVLTEKLVP